MHMQVQMGVQGQQYSKENTDLEGKTQSCLGGWKLKSEYEIFTFPFFFFSKPVLIRRYSPWSSYLMNVLGDYFVQIMLALILKAE